jgi:hypothetical protein
MGGSSRLPPVHQNGSIGGYMPIDSAIERLRKSPVSRRFL